MRLSGTSVLVTGGSGFIGVHVVAALRAAGAEVRVVDHRPFPDGFAGGGVASVVGDLRDPDTREAAVTGGLDAIVHLAAVTSVLGSVADPAGTYAVNVGVTRELLELARVRDVGRFVLASTNAVAGDVGAATITEDVPLSPLTPYGASKAAAEMLLAGYAGAYGMTTCALRLTNVYGPGMGSKDSFVPRLMRAAVTGGGVCIYGDGTQRRDFVHVDDVVAGLLAAWEASYTGPLIIGSGRSVRVLDLVAACRRVTGAEVPAEHVQAKAGEMPAVIVDIAAAIALGYHPHRTLDTGLASVWSDWTGGPDEGTRAVPAAPRHAG